MRMLREPEPEVSEAATVNICAPSPANEYN